MRTIIIISVLFTSMLAFSQEFQGKAIYKTHRKVNISIKSNNGMSKEKNDKLIEGLKKMHQKTYILNFSKTESMYQEDKELAPVARRGDVIVKMIGGSGSYMLYKNIADQTYRNQTEIGGKRFLIKDKLKNEDWEMSGETKKIGNYTCYKATKTNEVTRKSMLSVDGKEEQTEKKETITTTVWYAPQIPVSNGPGMYGGLPGLILEVQAGKKTIVCSEIVLNPKEKVIIKKPKKGKEVTQKEYAKIMEDFTKEMMERYRPKKSKKGNNNSISIEIGG